MIIYKIDVLQALIDAGYSTYKLRKDRILSEATLQRLRESKLVSWENVNKICSLLHCQPGDILAHIES